ncbi:MAG: GNAT family N-acetyltransferase [Polyangiales bacterium]
MEVVIRRIASADDGAIASIIGAVMPSFGASGPGFALHDAEVRGMFAAYKGPRHAYFVLDDGGVVVGGGGIAPLNGAAPAVCELRKMYLLSEARGRGHGERLLRHCLEFAKSSGFRLCYWETLTGMDAAQRLYERLGFVRRSEALGATGHFGCDRFYTLDLTAKLPPVTE